MSDNPEQPACRQARPVEDRSAGSADTGLLARRSILLLSAALTAGLTAVSWGVVSWARKEPLAALFEGALSLRAQVVWGLAVGLVVAAVTTWIGLKASFLEQLRVVVREVLDQVRPTAWDLVFVSAGAGWAEELFFRGVLQGYIGLWLTALVFALLHGFVLRLSWPGLLLTLYVFAAGVGLGYLYEQVGLAAAMCAHAVYDLVTLCGYVYDWKNTARAGPGLCERPPA